VIPDCVSAGSSAVVDVLPTWPVKALFADVLTLENATKTEIESTAVIKAYSMISDPDSSR
jgi:hypothetical protein